MFRRVFLPWIVYGLYRVLLLTWRVSRDECASFQTALATQSPVILAHWHGDELALIHLAKRYRIATITSTSRDGNLMDVILQRLGAVTARGSSTRGGANALRGVLQLCKKGGYNVSFAVDGPKGPIYEVKPGVFEFSRLMNCPIYVVSVTVSRPWIFHRAWNKAILPKFFSRVHVRVAEAMPAFTKQDDPRSPEFAHALAQHLHANKEQCQSTSK